MDKKIFHVYLAKESVPNNESYAKLDLPASPWEVVDALDKVRLNEGEQLYMEIEDYDAFEYLSPHLDGVDISLNELNDLAALLSVLDEVQEVAFEGLFSIEVQRKVNANGGVITLQDLRNLAVSAKTDCYHVVDAADDAQLGRFYAENEFIPELDGVSNEVFEMLDFAGIGRMMRQGGKRYLCWKPLCTARRRADHCTARPKDAAGKAGIPLPAHAWIASRHWRCAHGDTESSRSRGRAAGRTGTARCGGLGGRHGH